MSSSFQVPPDEVLVFGSSAIIEICGSVLRPNYRVATSDNAEAVLRTLARHTPSVLIADLDFSIQGPQVCEAAKAKSPTPAVLVTTTAPENVPGVLGVCDGVLPSATACGSAVARKISDLDPSDLVDTPLPRGIYRAPLLT